MFAREGSVAHHWISVRCGRIESGTSNEGVGRIIGASSGVLVDCGGPMKGTGRNKGEGTHQGAAGAGPVDVLLPLYNNRFARVWMDLMDPI